MHPAFVVFLSDDFFWPVTRHGQQDGRNKVQADPIFSRIKHNAFEKWQPANTLAVNSQLTFSHSLRS
jgi:hypothetical protein